MKNNLKNQIVKAKKIKMINKILIHLVIFGLLCGNCFANSMSKINSMKQEVSNLKDETEAQNDKLENIIGLSKKFILELYRGGILLKTHNELIMNAWHIESQK